MNTWSKFNKLLLALGLALLCGAGAMIIEPARLLPAVTHEAVDKAGDKDKEPGPTNPDGALRFRHLQMQDEKGDIPPDGLEKARQHVKRMKRAQAERLKARKLSGQESQPGALAAGIEPDSWTWLGPGNVGGRIRSIVIHPTNTNNMWVGSVSGGIWATQNGESPQASWFPVNDFLANLAVSTMIIDPTNPDTMYAGTGEGFITFTPLVTGLQGTQGAGVFKSTDGGVTWNQLASTNNANWFFVNRLAISPDGNTILAATNTGIWRSTNGGASWNRRTFVQTLDIDFHPTDSNRAIAGEPGFARLSVDGGQTWTFVDGNGTIQTAADFIPDISAGATLATNGRVELAYARSNPAIVYASVNNNNGDIYRSNDGGQTFARVNTGTNFFGTGGQGWYDNVVWVNPQDPTFVLVGGVWLWRSTDSGATFTQISDGQLYSGNTASPHADNHAIVAHPGFNNNTNQRVFVGNDGGIYRTDIVRTANVFNGWGELNNQLGITQFYGAAGNVATGVIVGGTQDNGTQRFTGGTESWTQMNGSDGGYCAADPTDSNFLYGETQNLGVVRSTNGGQLNSGNPIYCDPSQINPVTFRCNSGGIADAFNGANFIAPLVLDPIDPNTLLAGGIRLWRSQNVKAAIPAWAAIKNPTTGNSQISAIAVSPNTSALILVGHNNGDIFRTLGGTLADPTGTWTQIDTAALPNGRMVTRLVIDTTRGVNWFYAAFGGFAGDNVWRSTDNGATWTDITGTDTSVTGLPAVPVRTLVFHPTNPNLLYVGTEIGIFTSEDAGANWEPTQDGPANVSVDELFWMGGDLVAATHGRGLYRASGGVYVRCNYVGPEDGTFDRPFNTVTEAINATNRYRAVWIFSGTCTEPFSLPIDKRLELRSFGGPATLRRP